MILFSFQQDSYNVKGQALTDRCQVKLKKKGKA